MGSDLEKYLKEQKKLYQTKKDALQARKEKWSTPRPNQYKPPAENQKHKTAIWVGGTVIGLTLLLGLLFYNPSPPVASETRTLELWIQGTHDEFAQLNEWVSAEVEKSGLQWNIVHLTDRDQLYRSLAANDMPDLLLIDDDLATILYENSILAPLQDKHQPPLITAYYSPLWENRPWIKQIGWAIPRTSRLENARHLYTIMDLYSESLTTP